MGLFSVKHTLLLWTCLCRGTADIAEITWNGHSHVRHKRVQHKLNAPTEALELSKHKHRHPLVRRHNKSEIRRSFTHAIKAQSSLVGSTVENRHRSSHREQNLSQDGLHAHSCGGTRPAFRCSEERRSPCKLDEDPEDRGCNWNQTKCDSALYRGADPEQGLFIPCCEKQNLLTLLEFVEDSLCGKVDYCVLYGTLLAAVRDGDLIDWDSDVDVAIHAEDMDYARALFASNKKGFEVTGANPPVTRISLSSNDTVHIDVWWMTTFGNCTHVDQEWFPASWLAKPFTGTCTIQDRRFPCPAQHDKVLDYLYGPDDGKDIKGWRRRSGGSAERCKDIHGCEQADVGFTCDIPPGTRCVDDESKGVLCEVVATHEVVERSASNEEDDQTTHGSLLGSLRVLRLLNVTLMFAAGWILSSLGSGRTVWMLGFGVTRWTFVLAAACVALTSARAFLQQRADLSGLPTVLATLLACGMKLKFTCMRLALAYRQRCGSAVEHPQQTGIRCGPNMQLFVFALVPGTCFACCDALSFLSMAELDPVTNQVLLQVQVVLRALFQWVALRQLLSKSQWFALLLFTIAGFTKAAELDDARRGLLLVLLQAFLATCGSFASEFLLKKLPVQQDVLDACVYIQGMACLLTVACVLCGGPKSLGSTLISQASWSELLSDSWRLGSVFCLALSGLADGHALRELPVFLKDMCGCSVIVVTAVVEWSVMRAYHCSVLDLQAVVLVLLAYGLFYTHCLAQCSSLGKDDSQTKNG